MPESRVPVHPDRPDALAIPAALVIRAVVTEVAVFCHVDAEALTVRQNVSTIPFHSGKGVTSGSFAFTDLSPTYLSPLST